MTKDNLPIPRPEQTGALSLKRANQLLDITDKILAHSRQELALQHEGWMVRLWAWVKENGVPDLKWFANTLTRYHSKIIDIFSCKTPINNL